MSRPRIACAKVTARPDHLIACMCNACLDRQVADVYDTFGDDAGLRQRLENEKFIRRKAAFWDAFTMDFWRTPHDMTPMEDAKAMVEGVARLVAEYDAGRGPLVPTTAVHILMRGFPLCGFTTELPARWPAGHRWTSMEESHKTTCQACLDTIVGKR